MRILLVHESYQQKGGEDVVVSAERRLMESHGHEVVFFGRSNHDLSNRSIFSTVRAGVETVWASSVCRELKAVISKAAPAVAHFHNTFPLISPSAYYACAELGIPVIQTLHNYRLICPAATFLRDGKTCEECLGRRMALPAIGHGCYRGSRVATAAVAAMLCVHRAMGTWQEKVDLYVALSQSARQRFVDGGIPAERIAVKPNFVDPDPGPKEAVGEYALFAGRLASEKGLDLLIAAWDRLGEKIPLRIAGDGPLKESIAEQLTQKSIHGIEMLGAVEPCEVVKLLRKARFLVVSSIWYECFPMIIAEAFACGVPVIAPRLGALAEIVTDGKLGLHFSPFSAEDLADKVRWAWTHSAEMLEMGRHARAEYEAKYTADRNYEIFVEVWSRLGIIPGFVEGKTWN
jgi:glycosyltransferase involved in cell wall biosynthesis